MHIVSIICVTDGPITIDLYQYRFPFNNNRAMATPSRLAPPLPRPDFIFTLCTFFAVICTEITFPTQRKAEFYNFSFTRKQILQTFADIPLFHNSLFVNLKISLASINAKVNSNFIYSSLYFKPKFSFIILNTRLHFI